MLPIPILPIYHYHITSLHILSCTCLYEKYITLLLANTPERDLSFRKETGTSLVKVDIIQGKREVKGVFVGEHEI